MAGILDPTPFCDLTSAGISACRGDVLGVAVGLIGIIPILGDLAKFAKISKYVNSARRAIALMAKSEKARAVLRPALEGLHEALKRLPLDNPPKCLAGVVEKLRSLRDELAEALKKGNDGPTGIKANKSAGDAWERELLNNELPKTQSQIQPQITIKSNGPSGKRVRLDAVGTDTTTGGVKLTDGKASATAPLTPNQRVVYPELEKSGGVVVGKGKPPYVTGTQIPPTKVDILRKPDYVP